MALSIKTSISIFIGLIVLLIISTFTFSIFTIRQLRDNLQTQVHSRTIILTLKDNLINLIDAETGERGFVITGNANYLEPYHNALEHISANNAQLDSLIAGNNAEIRLMDSLHYFINLKLGYVKNIIALKTKGDEVAVKQILTGNHGKVYMDGIRRINAQMLAEEEKLFARHNEATNESITISSRIFAAEAVISFLITAYLAFTVYKELLRRVKAEGMMHAANMELQRKNAEIEQFAYIASHDLQEPLRSITNFSSLLTQRWENNEDTASKNYISYISGGAGRMSKLIFDLLEYSRVGKEVAKTPIDCNKIMEEVKEELSASIKDSAAEIIVTPLPVVQGYEYLKSVFLNLCANAIKFRKKELSAVVRVSSIQNEEEYTFEICDNGIGIEPEYFERIFKIFQKLHSRTEYEGTGIGLSQCRKIIDLHGGKIWLTSKPGEGTCFYFTIPKTNNQTR